jgi:rRNA maturation endonuclease Nob1
MNGNMGGANQNQNVVLNIANPVPVQMPANQIQQHKTIKLQDNRKIIFCPQCGKQLPTNSLFCSGCGHKITSDMAN